MARAPGADHPNVHVRAQCILIFSAFDGDGGAAPTAMPHSAPAQGHKPRKADGPGGNAYT
jgi:hypothetical protein